MKSIQHQSVLMIALLAATCQSQLANCAAYDSDSSLSSGSTVEYNHVANFSSAGTSHPATPDEASTAIKALDDNFSSAETSHPATLEEASSAINELDANFSSPETSHPATPEEASAALNALDAILKGLEEQEHAVDLLISAASESVQHNNEEIKDLKNTKTQLENEIQRLKGQINLLQTELNDARNRNDVLHASNVELKNLLNTANQKNSAMTQKFEQLSQKFSQLQEENSQLSAQKASLLEQIVADESIIGSLTKEKNDLTAKNDKIKNQVQILKGKLSAAGLGNKKLHDDTVSKQKEIDTLNATVSANEQAIHNLNNRLASKTEKVKKINERLKWTEQKLKDAGEKNAKISQKSKARKNEIIKLVNSIKERNIDIQNKVHEIERLNFVNKDLNIRKKELVRNNVISAFRMVGKDAAARNASERYSATIADKEAHLVRSADSIGMLNRQLEESRAIAAEKEGVIAEKEGVIKELQANLDSVNEDLNRQQLANKQLNSKNESIQSEYELFKQKELSAIRTLEGTNARLKTALEKFSRQQ